MEALGLSFNEVVNIVPFRTMILMMKDKQHTAYGEVLREVDESTFFKMRK